MTLCSISTLINKIGLRRIFPGNLAGIYIKFDSSARVLDYEQFLITTGITSKAGEPLENFAREVRLLQGLLAVYACAFSHDSLRILYKPPYNLENHALSRRISPLLIGFTISLTFFGIVVCANEKALLFGARGGPEHFPGRQYTRAFRVKSFTLALPFEHSTLARLIFSFCRFASTAMARPKVFFDINIGGKSAGRVVMEVSV